jgi:G3E family GTPase
MTAEEESGQNSSPPGPKWSADEIAEMEARADEAKQALTGMIFAALKMQGRKLRAARESLPLTVISGFLGSGKTTLLNHLLVSPHGRRLVVLVNDFGQINIDAALVSSQTDDMINLANGCACCAISSELTNALIEIAEREEPPDAIVLKASGIADPSGIAQTALTNPAIRFDGTLVAVDVVTLQTLAEDPLTSLLFHNQISAADLIVLSKVDLIDDPQRAEARQWLADRYHDKRVIEAVNGDVPPELILGIDTKRDLQAGVSEPMNHVREFES